MKYFFFFCQKSWFLHQWWHERGTALKERLPIGLLWTPPLLAQFGIFFQLTLQKHLCPPLSSLGLIIVTRFSQAALNIFLKNYKNYKAARLVLKAHKRDHVSPLLRTLHWLPIQTRIEYKLSTLCHSFFSNTAPVYLSDFLRVYSQLRQLRSFSRSRTLRISHIKTNDLDIVHFPMPLLLSGVLCLMTLDIFSQSLHLKLPWRLICSDPTSAS